MTALVNTNISTWTQAQKELVDDPVTDSAYVTSHGGDAAFTSFVEE